MVLMMTSKIVFHANDRRDAIILHQVSEIEFESSFKDLTDRGFLILPRKVKFFNKNNVKELFRRGDAITINFGYNGNNLKEFDGYITEVSADMPIVIKFEDEMYKIKMIPVNFSDPNTTLENLLRKTIPGYQIDAIQGVQLGGIRLANTTVGPVLAKLLSDWGLYTYMDGKKVVCGKYYADDDSEMVKFHLERNCVSTDLNYRKKEDVLLKIKCVSTLVNGQKITIDNIGDPNGTERVLTFYNIEVEAELEKLGLMAYKQYKQDGYDGSFTGFGTPSVKHGMKCEVISNLYRERSGIYYIERVVKNFGAGGIRQEITLGEKAA